MKGGVQSYHFLRECGYRYRGWQCISVAEYLILIVPVSWLLEIGRALSSLVRRNPFGFWLLTVDFFILVQVKLTVTSTSLFGT
jgi:hypothetical protein